MIKHEKILLCSSFLPPTNTGSGRNAYNFGEFLSTKGFEITLLTFNWNGKLRRRDNLSNLNIRRLLYYNRNMITKVLSMVFVFFGYIQQVYRNEVIFIYGSGIIGFEFIILVSWILGRKTVFRSTMMAEDDAVSLVKNGAKGKLRKHILSLVSHYFSTNPCFTDSWEQVFGKNYRLFESLQGVNTDVFYSYETLEKKDIRKRLMIPNDKFIILSVGFLIHRKGFKELFEILAELEIPFFFVMIGDFEIPMDHYLKIFNAEMKSLKEKGEEILHNKIAFIGPVENVNEYMGISDVFILNSENEGMPNVLLEAMASGVTCCVKNINGITDFLLFHKRNALIHNSKAELKKNILDLYHDKSLRSKISANSVKFSRENLSFEKVFSKMLYESTILSK